MYSSRTSTSSRRYGAGGAPPPSRRSMASGEPPLTAERAMMDQIRSKLERAQRRLARQPGMSGSQGSSSSVSSRYIPSSEYGSMMNRPAIQSVRLEDMPATTSSNYNSTASYGLPPPSTARHHAPPSRQGVPPSTSRRPPPSSRHPDSRHRDSRRPESSSKYAKQYQSRSKYAHSGSSQEDPLNGGPPPMSTPFLVYSSSRPPMSSAAREHHSIKSSRPPPSSRAPTHHRHESEAERERRLRREDEEARRRPPRELDPSRSQKPPMSTSTMLNGPPSAMRSGLPRPPSSRVRFEGHESEETSGSKAKEEEKTGKESEKEKKRRQHEKEVEIAHRRLHTQRLRQENKEHESNNPLAKPVAPSSPVATGTRQRRSRSIELPPNSAIKMSAFEATPSPMGRPRRSSINMPPPKSDIKVSAFDDVAPRRRGSGSEEPAALTPAEPEKDGKDAKSEEEPVEEATAAVVTDQPHSAETDEEELSEPVSPSPGPGTKEFHKEHEQGDDTSEAGSDESDVHEFSDFDVDSDLEELSSFVSDYDPPSSVEEVEIMGSDYVAEAPVSEDNNEAEEPPSKGTADEIDATEPAADADEPPPPPAEEEEDTVADEPRPSQRMTTKDLAFLALGRSSMSFSDTGSPVASTKGDGGSQRPPAAPMSMAYTPTSTAFPPGSRARRPPIPATMGRLSAIRSRGPRAVPPPPQTAGYVRRSRPRAPLDLNNELPPSIGVLSGLSSGPATFTMDPACFYEVTWTTGEFAFSLQRVYTDDNEFEFDDSNQEPQLFLRMLLNTDRSTCESFKSVRVGDVLIRVGDSNVSELGLEGSGSVLTKFFAKLRKQLPIRLTFQRMFQSEWEGGVEL